MTGLRVGLNIPVSNLAEKSTLAVSKPVSFDSFGLNPILNAAINAQGFETPTPIQVQAIPLALKGMDLMGLAQTGTGKTAAFVLPILEKLLKSKTRGVRALIVAPTRELAEQIHEVVKTLGQGTRLKSMTIYGGVGIGPQIQKLRAGVDIIVGCPGRILDHLGERTLRLDSIETLVIDEADQMFDMGFLPNIRKILKHLPKERQTLFFSATMPEEIRTLAREILHNPAIVEIGHRAPTETVAQALFPVPQHLKTALLMKLLPQIDTGSVLIFARTKHRTKRVAEQLITAGHSVASLQGNLSQNRRQEAMDGFRQGKYRILVATDIAARGIDVSQVSHVINYDIPSTTDAYTHRIGRTGRAAKTGDAFTFVSPEDAGMVRDIERVLKAQIERRTLAGFDYKESSAQRDEFRRDPRPPQGRSRSRTQTPRQRTSPDRRPASRGRDS